MISKQPGIINGQLTAGGSAWSFLEVAQGRRIMTEKDISSMLMVQCLEHVVRAHYLLI